MSLTAREVSIQLEEMDQFKTYIKEKELSSVHRYMDKGEAIKALLRGYFRGSNWLVVITQRRLLFLNKKVMGGMAEEEISLEDITELEYVKGLFLGKIRIVIRGEEEEIDNILKKESKLAVGILEELLDDLDREDVEYWEIEEAEYGEDYEDEDYGEEEGRITKEAESVDMGEDTIGNLERLADLMDRGVLTKEEFDVQKRRVLK